MHFWSDGKISVFLIEQLFLFQASCRGYVGYLAEVNDRDEQNFLAQQTTLSHKGTVSQKVWLLQQYYSETPLSSTIVF